MTINKKEFGLFVLILMLISSQNVSSQQFIYDYSYNVQIGDTTKYGFTNFYINSSINSEEILNSIFTSRTKDNTPIHLNFTNSTQITVKVTNISINELYYKTGNELYNYKIYNLSLFYDSIQMQDLILKSKDHYISYLSTFTFLYPIFDNATAVDNYISNQSNSFPKISRNEDYFVVNFTSVNMYKVGESIFSEVWILNWKTGWLDSYELFSQDKNTTFVHIKLEKKEFFSSTSESDKIQTKQTTGFNQSFLFFLVVSFIVLKLVKKRRIIK